MKLGPPRHALYISVLSSRLHPPSPPPSSKNSDASSTNRMVSMSTSLRTRSIKARRGLVQAIRGRGYHDESFGFRKPRAFSLPDCTSHSPLSLSHATIPLSRPAPCTLAGSLISICNTQTPPPNCKTAPPTRPSCATPTPCARTATAQRASTRSTSSSARRSLRSIRRGMGSKTTRRNTMWMA